MEDILHLPLCDNLVNIPDLYNNLFLQLVLFDDCLSDKKNEFN